MNENKDDFDKNDDESNKWDLILASIFTILLVFGLLISGIVLFKMTN